MTRQFWRRPPAITPAKHLAGLRAKFPSGRGSVERETLIWSMTVRPTPYSLEYLIEVECTIGKKPAVYASGGEIERVDDLSEIPHKYTVDEGKRRVELCLDYREWHRDDPVATTLVPWAIEWLVHFEIWLTTGKWTGGGIHDGVLEE